MPTRHPTPPTQSAVRIFATNERLNQLLIEHLDPAVWTAKPPGNVRTIAAIFAHMHNVRTKWIRLTAPHLGITAQLNRAHSTPQQASKALAGSATRCEEMLAEALQTLQSGEGNRKPRITHFVRDGWAKPWPVVPEMLCYISRTKLTIAARLQCSRISSASLCRTPSHPICGTGKNSGSRSETKLLQPVASHRFESAQEFHSCRKRTASHTYRPQLKTDDWLLTTALLVTDHCPLTTGNQAHGVYSVGGTPHDRIVPW